jgi:hypothetical protein
MELRSLVRNGLRKNDPFMVRDYFTAESKSDPRAAKFI